jgi:hypothetical protein
MVAPSEMMRPQDAAFTQSYVTFSPQAESSQKTADRQAVATRLVETSAQNCSSSVF